MSPPEVVVLPTGTANLASVLAAFARLGAKARIASDAAIVVSKFSPPSLENSALTDGATEPPPTSHVRGA